MSLFLRDVPIVNPFFVQEQKRGFTRCAEMPHPIPASDMSASLHPNLSSGTEEAPLRKYLYFPGKNAQLSVSDTVCVAVDLWWKGRGMLGRACIHTHASVRAVSIEWLYCRGPGFLAVVWFGSSFPLSCKQFISLSQTSYVSPVELTDGRGVEGGAKSYDCENLHGPL